VPIEGSQISPLAQQVSLAGLKPSGTPVQMQAQLEQGFKMTTPSCPLQVISSHGLLGPTLQFCPFLSQIGLFPHLSIA